MCECMNYTEIFLKYLSHVLSTQFNNIWPVCFHIHFFFLLLAAANMCFSERSIYTQEVLAIVMQRLMEQTPLPTLLMRTVIQSLSMYPRLIGFVLNILQRLILKQVNSSV